MRRVLPLGLLALTTVVVQVAVMPHLRLFGVVPDLGLVLAIAVAYYDDAETAAIVGFVTGLGFDLFLRTPVGASALAYAVTGYLTGVVQAGLIRSSRWLPLVLGGLGGLVGGLMFVGIAILAGTDSLIRSGHARDRRPRRGVRRARRADRVPARRAICPHSRRAADLVARLRPPGMRRARRSGQHGRNARAEPCPTRLDERPAESGSRSSASS